LNDKLHLGKPIAIDYPEHITEFDKFVKLIVIRK
jgi:hypothetical protein